ncbi:MAG: hypothetical protein WC792_05900 [Candidatus Micrarchaeia archaeon]
MPLLGRGKMRGLEYRAGFLDPANKAHKALLGDFARGVRPRSAFVAKNREQARQRLLGLVRETTEGRELIGLLRFAPTPHIGMPEVVALEAKPDAFFEEKYGHGIEDELVRHYLKKSKADLVCAFGTAPGFGKKFWSRFGNARESEMKIPTVRTDTKTGREVRGSKSFNDCFVTVKRESLLGRIAEKFKRGKGEEVKFAKKL